MKIQYARVLIKTNQRILSLFWPLFILFTAITSFFWVKAKDSIERVEFKLKIPDDLHTTGLLFLPKDRQVHPIIIYLHGAGGSIRTSGDKLRLFAECNLAAIDIDYDQTNQKRFNNQLIELFDYISRQSRINTNAIAIVGASMGAQRSLKFLVLHPEYRPQLLVRLSGGWVEELDNGVAYTNYNRSVHVKPWPSKQVLLIHGSDDEVFPVEDCLRVSNNFALHGALLKVSIFTGESHSFGLNHLLIVRYIAEYCAIYFGEVFPPRTVNFHCNCDYYWLPLLLYILVNIIIYLRNDRIRGKSAADPFPRATKILILVISLLCITFILLIITYCVAVQLMVGDATLAIAGKFFVRDNERADFEALVDRPIWKETRLRTLLDHLELAGYNRLLINWQFDDKIYREQVLSPVITGETGEQLNWRRPLWEEFYPRIRHESSPEDAAKIVVRHLRERVTVLAAPNLPHAIPDIWQRQITDPTGFEIIYVAALRSVGVPARLDRKGKAELFADNNWQSAPRPVIYEAISP